MSHTDTILELLDDVFPDAYCDDCLSNELQIQHRQQVNQLGRRLADLGKTTRQRGVCSSCKKIKTINALIQSDLPSSKTKAGSISRIPPVQQFDIEQARTEIVRLCIQIWEQHTEDAPPRSISVLINTLKNADILPPHPANMMLTLCNLRNVYVYEKVRLGPRELTIAENAFGIIQEWWNTAQE